MPMDGHDCQYPSGFHYGKEPGSVCCVGGLAVVSVTLFEDAGIEN